MFHRGHCWESNPLFFVYRRSSVRYTHTTNFKIRRSHLDDDLQPQPRVLPYNFKLVYEGRFDPYIMNFVKYNLCDMV